MKYKIIRQSKYNPDNIIAKQTNTFKQALDWLKATNNLFNGYKIIKN